MRARAAPEGATQETINEHSKEEVFKTSLIPDKDRALCAICLEDYEVFYFIIIPPLIILFISPSLSTPLFLSSPRKENDFATSFVNITFTLVFFLSSYFFCFILMYSFSFFLFSIQSA